LIPDLIKLSDELDQLGYITAANSVDGIISLALNYSQIEYKQPSKNRATGAQALSAVQTALDILGLVPVYGEVADFTNAVLYLSQGLNQNNLLLAGLSITSMVPTLGDVSKVLKYGSKLAPEVLKKIAQTLLSKQGAVRAVFTKMADPKNLSVVQSAIPNIELLVKNANRMFEAVRAWLHNIINYKAKQEVSDASGLTDQPSAS